MRYPVGTVATYNGIPIILNDWITERPAMQTTPEFDATHSPEEVAALNAIMLETFGVIRTAYVMKEFGDHGQDVLVVHREEFERIKNTPGVRPI